MLLNVANGVTRKGMMNKIAAFVVVVMSVLGLAMPASADSVRVEPKPTPLKWTGQEAPEQNKKAYGTVSASTPRFAASTAWWQPNRYLSDVYASAATTVAMRFTYEFSPGRYGSHYVYRNVNAGWQTIAVAVYSKSTTYTAVMHNINGSRISGGTSGRWAP